MANMTLRLSDKEEEIILEIMEMNDCSTKSKAISLIISSYLSLEENLLNTQKEMNETKKQLISLRVAVENYKNAKNALNF